MVCLASFSLVATASPRAFSPRSQGLRLEVVWVRGLGGRALEPQATSPTTAAPLPVGCRYRSYRYGPSSGSCAPSSPFLRLQPSAYTGGHGPVHMQLWTGPVILNYVLGPPFAHYQRVHCHLSGSVPTCCIETCHLVFETLNDRRSECSFPPFCVHEEYSIECPVFPLLCHLVCGCPHNWRRVLSEVRAGVHSFLSVVDCSEMA